MTSEQTLNLLWRDIILAARIDKRDTIRYDTIRYDTIRYEEVIISIAFR